MRRSHGRARPRRAPSRPRAAAGPTTSAAARARPGGPCYFVSVAMWGDGKVTSTMPAPVPGASTPAEQYPNGHIECPPASIWGCDFFFNWSFGDDTTVILQATTTSGQTFLGWVDCPHVQGTNNRQCRIEQEDPHLRRSSFRSQRPQISNCDEPPPPPPPPINVRVVKAGGGRARSRAVRSRINCGLTCQGSLPTHRHPDRDAGRGARRSSAGVAAATVGTSCMCPTSGTLARGRWSKRRRANRHRNLRRHAPRTRRSGTP